MPRLNAIQPEQATGKARELLEAVSENYGMVPNLVRTLANSPAALQGYLSLGQSLEEGELSEKLREQLALTVSVANGCGYCESAHWAIGKSVGLSDSKLSDARQATSPDSKVEAALQFVRLLIEKRGWVDDAILKRVRRAGYSDGQIAEMVAIVAWKTFANYFNHVAGTEIDFPPVSQVASQAAAVSST